MKRIAFVLFWIFCAPILVAQNLDGLVINVAKIAPAYIKFNDKIKTAEFSTTTAYDNYLIRVRNDDNTIIIQYTGQGKAPEEGLSITEGNRRHFFILSFLPDYDINKHKQLYYTFDDLKKLKQKVQTDAPAVKDTVQLVAVQDKIRIEEEKERQRNLEKQEALQARERALLKKKLEQEKKEQALLERQQEAALAKAKTEADAKEKERAKALRQEQALQEEQAKLQKKKQADEENAKAIAKKQEQLDKAALERTQKEAAQQLALRKLDSLKEIKFKKEQDAAYSVLGLWKRYGQYNINLYEIPKEQMNWINTDYFIAADTLLNYNNAQKLLKEAPRNIGAEYGTFKNNVQLTLTGISFAGPFTYYKINVNNKTDADFLTGATVMEIYDKDKQHIQQIKCSYFTHIAFYPIVKPHSQTDVVFVTRTPTVAASDDVIIYMNERREAYGQNYILIKGRALNGELDKIEKEIPPSKKKKKRK